VRWDVSEERKLFTFAGELMTKGDFDQAEHVLEGIKVGLNDKRVNMKKRINILERYSRRFKTQLIMTITIEHARS